jgi:hypothetical protein
MITVHIHVIAESLFGLGACNIKVRMSYTVTPEEETGMQGVKEI